MLDTECSTESSVEEFEFSLPPSSTVSSREESDCFMGMIVWEAGGVSLENKLVKKPVTEERTPAVLFSTITPTFLLTCPMSAII